MTASERPRGPSPAGPIPKSVLRRSRRPGLPCPACGGLYASVTHRDTKVVNQTHTYVRRRCCRECNHRWNTYEVPLDVAATLSQSAQAQARTEAVEAVLQAVLGLALEKIGAR